MTGEELKQAAIGLYGKWGWQARVATALGRNSSTIRRWVSGELSIPLSIEVAVRGLLRESDEP